jgi:hypothetical protein
MELQSPQTEVTDFVGQQFADSAAFGARRVPGKTDKVARISLADLGNFFIRLFVLAVVDGEDDGPIDAGFAGVLDDSFGVAEGVPG